MKALVVGYGSIGKRHARLLAPLVVQLAVVSSQNVTDYRCYATLERAIAEFAPSHIVIANITSRHGETLGILKTLGFTGYVLVEKPLFSHAAQNNEPYPFSLHIAYQLRFHALIQALAETLKNRKILTAHIYVGQHLDSWRPGRVAKATYSAHKAQGGGVLRDLSHELDLISHLFGPIEQSYAIGGRVGDVTVDSDDAVALALRCRACPVISLQMNYLDHVARREWIINTQDASIRADLIQGTLIINNEIKKIAYEPDDAYLAMYQAWLAGDTTRLCRFEEALALVKLIDKVAL